MPDSIPLAFVEVPVNNLNPTFFVMGDTPALPILKSALPQISPALLENGCTSCKFLSDSTPVQGSTSIAYHCIGVDGSVVKATARVSPSSALAGAGTPIRASSTRM